MYLKCIIFNNLCVQRPNLKNLKNQLKPVLVNLRRGSNSLNSDSRIEKMQWKFEGQSDLSTITTILDNSLYFYLRNEMSS